MNINVTLQVSTSLFNSSCVLISSIIKAKSIIKQCKLNFFLF